MRRATTFIRLLGQISASINTGNGYLYNWYAITNSNGLPITGWNIPTEDDYTILKNYLGGFLVAGGHLKESGTTHWNSPNTDADNTSGFTALGSGYRDSSTGAFADIRVNFNGWLEGSNKYAIQLQNSSGSAYTDITGSPNSGFSVRCTRFKPSYGALYNWYAVNTDKLAPTNTSIPTVSDVVTFYNYLLSTYGGYIGSALKEPIEGTSPNWGPYSGIINTNYTKFTALPGGVRGVGFSSINTNGWWWKRESWNTSNARYFRISYDNNGFPYNDGYIDKLVGMSVRCIVDSGYTDSTITDLDGNIYDVITIGTQKWLAQDLRVTQYNDGSAIPNVTDQTTWNGLTTGAYCYYNNGATPPVAHIPTTIVDYDTNIYNVIEINRQLWLKENLKVTHYRNGTEIPEITDAATWVGLSTGARCAYNNDHSYI